MAWNLWVWQIAWLAIAIVGAIWEPEGPMYEIGIVNSMVFFAAGTLEKNLRKEKRDNG